MTFVENRQKRLALLLQRANLSILLLVRSGMPALLVFNWEIEENFWRHVDADQT
jgi:hypothetical protein